MVLAVRCRLTCFVVQAQDGQKGIAVGAPIGIIGEEGDDISGAEQLAAESAEKPKAAEKAPEAPKSEPISEKKAEAPKQETKSELPTGDRIFASPIAKKIALEKGIPLAKVKGTGPNGRIIREDVEKYQPPAASASAAPASAPSPSASLPEYTDTPVSNMRRTIGTRLTQSKQELPHYYLTLDINMDKVFKLREVFNKTLGDKDKSAKLSVNDFVLKAVACALSDVPEANSAWLGEVIRQYVQQFVRGRVQNTNWSTDIRRLTSPLLSRPPRASLRPSLRTSAPRVLRQYRRRARRSRRRRVMASSNPRSTRYIP